MTNEVNPGIWSKFFIQRNGLKFKANACRNELDHALSQIANPQLHCLFAPLNVWSGSLTSSYVQKNHKGEAGKLKKS